MDENKRYLSASDILDAKDIETVEVEVPEWNGVVRLRALSGEEALRFIELVQKDKTGAALKIVALCAVDETGAQLFSPEQVEQLKTKSLRAIMRLQNVALRINGLSEAAPVEAKND